MYLELQQLALKTAIGRLHASTVVFSVCHETNSEVVSWLKRFAAMQLFDELAESTKGCLKGGATTAIQC
jgi:hypothetical protein